MFYREYDDGAYNVEPFFLAYLTLEIPFEFVMSTICTLFLLIPGFPSTMHQILQLIIRYGGIVLLSSLPGLLLCQLWGVSRDYVLHLIRPQRVKRQLYVHRQLTVYLHGWVRFTRDSLISESFQRPCQRSFEDSIGSPS